LCRRFDVAAAHDVKQRLTPTGAPSQNQPNSAQNRSLIVDLFAVKQTPIAGLAQR
jgi:hypothetical protein